MTRRFARRFNNFYGVEYFKEPVAYSDGTQMIKVPGLDGSGKMGKSEGNCIFLIDDPETIRKKVMRALTDQGPTTPNSVKPDYIENLFTIMRIISAPETLSFFEEKWNTCEIRYGDMKKQLAADIIEAVIPIRERILEINANPAILHKAVTLGKEKARESAGKTIREVREIMGFRNF
jgi:tryptophanyl-tRNA synthetase